MCPSTSGSSDSLKGEKISFFQFVVSNHCSDVQKLFSVISDGTKYVLKNKLQYNAKKTKTKTQLVGNM